MITGTFIIRPTHQDSLTPGSGFIVNGIDSVEAVFADDADSIEGFAIGAPAKSGQVRYNFVGLSIYLDGSLIPTSFQNLPSGWTPTSATLTADGANTFVESGVLPSNTAAIYLQYDTFSEKIFTGNNSHTDGPFSYILPSPIPSALDLINNGCGVRWILGSVGGVADFFINRLFISGTYVINQFTFTLSNDGGNIFPNSRVTITSPDGGLTNLLQNGGVDITWIDPSNGGFHTFSIPLADFVSITPTRVILIIFHNVPVPTLPPPGTRVHVTIPGNGTQFSGSITVGTFILIADASGIYTIIKDKRNDTLYNHISIIIPSVFNIFELEDEIFDISIMNPVLLVKQGLPEEESIENDLAFVPFIVNNFITPVTDVNIPDPFIKTAMIGS